MIDNNIAIKELKADDIELLLSLRMEVLSNVFFQEKEKLSDAEWNDIRKENEDYYQEELKKGGHVACAIYVAGANANISESNFIAKLQLS